MGQEGKTRKKRHKHVPVGVISVSEHVFLSKLKTPQTLKILDFPWLRDLFMSGEDGIRTHAPLRTNGFQDRLVMTTSIPLQLYNYNALQLCYYSKRAVELQACFKRKMFRDTGFQGTGARGTRTSGLQKARRSSGVVIFMFL